MSNILSATEEHFAAKDKIHLPVVKEQRFYPTESSVVIKDPDLGTDMVLGACARATYYRYTGLYEGEPYSAYTHWIFLTGKQLEKGLLEAWKDMGILLGSNIKFNTSEHHISGELDAIINDDGEKVIAEIKTYYGYEATKSLCGNPKKGIVGKPKDAHLLQTLVYLYLHREFYKKAKIFYLDKVCQSNAEFNIKLSSVNGLTYASINGDVDYRFPIEKIFERYKYIKTHVDAMKTPARDFELQYSDEKIEKLWAAGRIGKTKYEEWQKKSKKKITIGDWQCSYCKYKDICYSEQTKSLAENPSVAYNDVLSLID